MTGCSTNGARPGRTPTAAIWANPLADHYAELLKNAVHDCDEATLLGAWRTGVYLLGDRDTYLQLEAVWRAAFGGSAPKRDPLQCRQDPHAPELARWWALPDDLNGPAPGAYRRPFSHQSILTSRELGSYVALPEQEHPGFRVRTAATFSVARPAPTTANRTVDVGAVVVHDHPTSERYRIGVDDLTRHAFVAGLTGAGKTNTVIHLVSECARTAVPFLVIEPAKAEYRALLTHPTLANSLRVFTVGKESVSPLRLNPLEIPAGVDVSEHVDLLKATFAGSFAMWVPLPQILEQALIQLYTDRGWDFATGRNTRSSNERAPSPPTLSELIATIERIVPTLGYKPETTQEISAALVGRLRALTRGTRGLMLDVATSVPTAELLSAPTVIELEGLADDDDKAFVMGVLLTRLYEHRRAENRRRTSKDAPGTLRHLLVVEEAHRLLARSEKPGDSYHADPSGAFVTLFGQMLAEIRSYGQAIVIVDQIPVRLAPEVLKNTNLKICHRLVAKDDRDAVAATMSMSEAQSAYLTRLQPGRTAVFSEGDHTPLLVDVPQVKDHTGDKVVTDADVTDAMRAWHDRPDVLGFFRGRASCTDTCATAAVCRSAAALARTSAGRLVGTRLLGSLLEHADGFDSAWRDVLALAAAELQPHDDLSSLVAATGAHLLVDRLERRADQGRWPTALVEAATSAAVDVVLERTRTPEYWLGDTPPRRAFVERLTDPLRRRHDPFPLCGTICPDQTCRYRDPVRDLVLEPRHTRSWAEPDDQADPELFIQQRSTEVAEDVVDAPEHAPNGFTALAAARYRVAACAIQIRVAESASSHTDPQRIARIIGLTGWDIDVPSAGQPRSV